MDARTMGRVEDLLKEVTTLEELGELERFIQEAKTKYLTLHKTFWTGKTHCWTMCNCPDPIKSECPAPRHEDTPCWEIEGTYCKLDDQGASGQDIDICQSCRVYKRWGDSVPVKITLFGEGIDTSLRRIG